MDLARVKQVAWEAAEEAGTILLDHLGSARVVHKKGAIDLVTEADLASEKAIVGRITQAFEDHAILAEEQGVAGGESRFQWIIDPLDGTTNYAHRIPIFGVSIAFAVDGETVFGVVSNPCLKETFWAAKGEGAFLNNEPIGVSDTDSLTESLLVTGFPYDLARRMDDLMPRFARCLLASQGIRRLGSAAMDLCYVACGRFEGFWEQNLSPWDTAAGACIAREAGGRVTDFSGRPHHPDSPEILATNGHIHEALATILQTPDTDQARHAP